MWIRSAPGPFRAFCRCRLPRRSRQDPRHARSRWLLRPALRPINDASAPVCALQKSQEWDHGRPVTFRLVRVLLRHQGHLVSREMPAREVWREPRRATPLDNVIDVQMTRLRKKVDTDGGPRLIHTVRGVGFVLREGEP